jgi:transposase
MRIAKIAVREELPYVDSEVCEGCGRRVELQRIQGYPGELFFKCPKCGYVDADTGDEVAEWM